MSLVILIPRPARKHTGKMRSPQATTPNASSTDIKSPPVERSPARVRSTTTPALEATDQDSGDNEVMMEVVMDEGVALASKEEVQGNDEEKSMEEEKAVHSFFCKYMGMFITTCTSCVMVNLDL